jgi:uroporphyrinogen decarboxylase
MEKRKPDFENVLLVMGRERPTRPTLYELFMNMPLYELVNGRRNTATDMLGKLAFTAEAFAAMGFDYVTTHACPMTFPANKHGQLDTISLNDLGMISDRESYDKYPWPNPHAQDYSHLAGIKKYLPSGMKLMVMGPGGVLENVIALTGYDSLCYMLYEDEELVIDLFDRVGATLLAYYERALSYDAVGFLCSNDDWGFNTQTFLSPAMMRRYVFPWHKKFVDLAHSAGKPILLHSCGNLREVMEDIIAMGYDAKHSFEDAILPVEDVYEKYQGRIAIAGGMDVDFVCRESEKAIRRRVEAMIERTNAHGGYFVGTGNSVPEYMPAHKYLAIVREAIGYDPLA